MRLQRTTNKGEVKALASTIEKIKQLREETAAGMMDVKRALEESEGDVEGARKVLRERGQALAAKKSGRAATEGLIEAYVHFNGRVGVLVEVNCETDFVARTPEFKEFARNVALHVASMTPLTQPYVKEPDKTVGELLQETIQRVGENIVIRRFVRYEL